MRKINVDVVLRHCDCLVVEMLCFQLCYRDNAEFVRKEYSRDSLGSQNFG